jgi:hypothetical protein
VLLSSKERKALEEAAALHGLSSAELKREMEEIQSKGLVKTMDPGTGVTESMAVFMLAIHRLLAGQDFQNAMADED